MGLFSALLGNAGAVSQEELQKKYGDLLTTGEEIELGFKLVRDTFIFTTKRLILVDIQGITWSEGKILDGKLLNRDFWPILARTAYHPWPLADTRTAQNCTSKPRFCCEIFITR